MIEICWGCRVYFWCKNLLIYEWCKIKNIKGIEIIECKIIKVENKEKSDRFLYWGKFGCRYY